MHTVFQMGEYDCGVACLAMLADISYDDAKNIIGSDYQPNYGVDPDPMLDALGKCHFRVVRRGRLSQSNSVGKLTNHALLHCKLLPSRGSIDPNTNTYSHWAVWDADARVVRDPYEYKKPIWLTSYIELERKK